MVDLFLYGSLRHVPLLETVLGRAGGRLDLVAAELPDMVVCEVAGAAVPAIAPSPGKSAVGLLLRGLDQEDITRLSFHEGCFHYSLQPVTVALRDGAMAPAQVFLPPSGRWRPGPAWSLQDWVAHWGALSVRAAVEVMASFGQVSADEIARRFPAIRRRAAAYVAAQARPRDPERDLAQDVMVQNHSRPYTNFFAVEEMDLQFRRHDGSMSPKVNRAALIVGEAVVVLPYDPVRDRVLLIEQFRAPVFIGGDRAPWIWEPFAGLVDPGETATEAAHREAMEEAGLTLSHLEPAGEAYASTGSSSEYLHLFVGLANLADTPDNAGLAEEGEDIRARILGFSELMAGIDAHRFRDMPLVATALWLARHRSRLRGDV